MHSYKELIQQPSDEDRKLLEKAKSMIFHIKKHPEIGGQIMRSFVERNQNVVPMSPIKVEDSKFLLNFSNLFYDNLYLEEKNALHKQSYFIEAFQNFVQSIQFKTNAIGNVVMTQAAANKVVKILFEGQTRKISANNFLRFIFYSNFTKIFISQIQESIIRNILANLKRTRQSTMLSQSSRAQNPEQNPPQNPSQPAITDEEEGESRERRDGFFNKIKNIFKRKNKETGESQGSQSAREARSTNQSNSAAAAAS